MEPEKNQTKFERCWPWLEAALEAFAYTHNDTIWLTHNKEHLWGLIAKDKAFFWPAKTCAIVTYIVTYPTGLRTHTTWLAGGALAEIKRMTPHIEEWGRQRGCHMQVGHGREGWLRALDGYEKHGVYRKKDLVFDDPSEWRAARGYPLWTRPW